MNENLPKIDRLFYDALEGMEVEPSTVSWANIERQLNKTDESKYKRRYGQMVKLISCFVLLFFSLILHEIWWDKSIQVSEKHNSNLAGQDSIYPDNKENSIIPLTEYTGRLRVSKQKTRELDKSYFDGVMSLHKLYPGENQAYQTNTFGEIQNDYSAHDSFFFPSAKNLSFYDQAKLYAQYVNDDLEAERKLSRPKTSSRFSLTVFVSPDVITNRLNEEYEYANQGRAEIEGRERDDFSFTTGISLSYDLSNHWSLLSGLSFSNASSWISPVVVKAAADNAGVYKFKLATTYGLGEITKSGISNPGNGDSIQLNSTTQHLSYLTVPIGLKYSIPRRNFAFSANVGLGFNLITAGQIQVDVAKSPGEEKELIQKIEGLKKTFINGIVGLDASYEVNKKWNVNVGPVFRYALTPVNRYAPIRNFPINMGLAIGIRRRL